MHEARSTLSIATWNVNSVRSRLAHLLDWLKQDKPDIVLLQELKCVDEAFPSMEIEDLGYNLAIHGEKTYNGVAILSKYPLSDVRHGLPGDDTDTQARYIEAVISVEGRGSRVEDSESRAPRPSPLILRVASVYVPNGQTADSDKFQYKLRFLDRLHMHVKTLLAYEEMLIIGGDYNVAPDDVDVHNPKEWEGSVLTHDEVRRRLRSMLYLGMYNAIKVASDKWQVTSQHFSGHLPLATGHYSWWDYRAGAFDRDDGLLIDHLLLSPQAADRLSECSVKKNLRALDKPSDHAPVVAGFNL